MEMNRVGVIVSTILILGCQPPASKEGQKLMHGNVKHLNPPGLHKNPAYTQAVVVSGNATTIYVGGQNAVDTSGNIVGKGDLRVQTGKALQNVETALAAGGAELQHVVKWNIYVVHGQSAQAGVEAFQKVWGQRPNPPVVTVLFVAALAHPDFLVEIDAVAVVPQK
jgi:enamine deaminase RidA (YjgF/YER057c/UK114 family)